MRPSSRDGVAESNNARASAAGSPDTDSSGRPSSSRPGCRAPNTRAIDSTSSLRPTKPSTCAEARSSHCASSTRHSSGRSPETSESRPNTPSPTRKRSGGAPARIPNAVSSASHCGSGRCGSRSSSGKHSWCSAANANSISDSTPTARRMFMFVAVRAMCRGARTSPHRLAAEHEHAALARADRRDHLLERGTLRPSPE
jgi:hypothetical protein